MNRGLNAISIPQEKMFETRLNLSPKFILLISAITLGYLVISIAFISVVSYFVPDFREILVKTSLEESNLELFGKDLVVQIIFMCIIPAIVEEFLFRYLPYKLFRKILPSFAIMIIFSVIFAAFHSNLGGMSMSFFVGALFYILFVTSGSLKFCIFAHFFHNLILVLVNFFFTIPGFNIDGDINFIPGWIVATGLLLFSLGLSLYFIEIKALKMAKKS